MLNDAFHRRDGALWCEDVPLDALAEAAGTPVYVYSAARITENVARLRAAFDPLGAAIHYSLKANANLTLIRLLSEAGLGMDAVSAGEIYRALEAGVAPERIVFAGVGKTPQELAYALDAGIGWFNVESETELRVLDTLAGARGVRARVALRVNPGVAAQTHRHIATGHFGAKFGLPPAVVADILARHADYPHVSLAGLHVHIGSQLARPDETVEAARAVQALAAPYADVRTLNIGGGFPVEYTGDEGYPGPQAFADALAPLLNGWQVKIEPGRSVIADAGALLIGVLYVKEQGGQRFILTDGSMTELIRPALYEAVHPVEPLRALPGDVSEAVVAGPVCESADVLNRAAPLPDVQPGDRLAVLGTGAYGMVMASNYNMRVRPPEVLVQGAQWRIVRRRETWDDLLALERDAASK
ncbi:MAG TPA: diaminopimelate decarboxylase [Aggregatilinea sp.]|uniref:diaminopimelate decarboxylase n=1 Tax=Aggregatilinea sp. TaxID=2806333 RepID=UPI002C57278C|nr:diaminopimelate decarboxylase [Aggregatilinea sp.]HML20708.1 diaminopimelate decarboxylase [Aggregatilinea sp.]